MKAVFLDLGGIVIQIDWARPFEFVGIFDSRRRQEAVAAFQGSNHFHKFERGEMTPGDFYAGLNGLLGVGHPIEVWREAWRSLIIGPLEGIEAVFDFLKSRSIPVFSVSNTNIDHYEHQMKVFPILNRFDGHFPSYKLGARKPDADYFAKVVELSGFKPTESLFIDDTFENVEAARRFGYTAGQTINSPRETLNFLKSKVR